MDGGCGNCNKLEFQEWTTWPPGGTMSNVAWLGRKAKKRSICENRTADSLERRNDIRETEFLGGQNAVESPRNEDLTSTKIEIKDRPR